MSRFAGPVIILYTIFLSCLALFDARDSFCAPNVRAAMLLNLANGKVLYERNADRQIPPASLTKIMTMLLTFDAIKKGRLKLNQKIVIDKQAASIGGSAMSLYPGEKIPVVRLLAGMAIASGNDAATALATKIGGSNKKFTSLMNARAKGLGMKNTTFKNPTGLPAAGQNTTARDLAKLCRAYLRSYPQARRFHKMTFYMHKGKVWRNTNPLLDIVPGVDGLKTGWTVASGYNLIITARRGSTRILAIILGGANKNARDAMARKLVEAGFKYPNNPVKAAKMINGR